MGHDWKPSITEPRPIQQTAGDPVWLEHLPAELLAATEVTIGGGETEGDTHSRKKAGMGCTVQRRELDAE